MKILKFLAIAAPMLCGFSPTNASVHTLRSKGEVLLIARPTYTPIPDIETSADHALTTALSLLSR
ncbi:MAG: hypothetical protein K2H33_04225 [Muribaculaceae bacterium]|nr:hypothetical protein [Muribaculaceae bacterium]MDE6119756.1 hypothetical protein [Muribaculaceae bacterium]